MSSRPLLLLVVMALCFGGTACTKKKTVAQLRSEKAQVFKDQQKNAAILRYQELTTKYPDSEFSAKARERLQVLGPPKATPKPVRK